MATFFTSDTHFGDWRAIRIDRRPYAAPEAMDDDLVRRWNETVGPADVVWHLGDFAVPAEAGRVAALLDALHGTKHLILGNNDPPATRDARGWASVQHYAEIEADGVPLVLAHYAFRTWNGMGKGRVNLHGHSHGRLSPQTRQYDVGVDVWDYRPVTIETVRARRRGGRPRPGWAEGGAG